MSDIIIDEAFKNNSTIYMVDDNIPLVKALARNVEQAGFKTRCFSQPKEFLNQYKDIGYNCLVLDVRMPEMTGDELQQALIEKNIRIPIIFISGFTDVPVIVDTLKNGAIDFLTKPVEKEKLLETIEKALKKDYENKQSKQENREIIDCVESLTNRELEIIKLIVEGKLNKIIAYDLNISINTVENHRAKIMKKMKAQTLAELIHRYRLVHES
jgi:two-component system response regulator TtrR